MHRTLLKLTRKSLCIFVAILLSLQCSWALSLPLPVQDRMVSGKVTSTEDGLGFPGINVVVKGTTIGTTTDAEGNYAIKVPSDESVLIFSAIGYTTEERTVGTQTAMDISMTPDITTLSEVVVVGYGTVKKTDVTGSVISISEKTLRERPTPNLLQAIQGKAPGVNVSTNIKPGEVPAVTIRGSRSLQASNAPLYVVDGIPLMPGDNNSDNGNSSSPPMLADINPNDIASMEILKDASATAIYGSRGANGVVLITTKKGTKGKVSVSYNATVSLDSYKSLTKWMNAGQYIDQHRLGLINGGQYLQGNTPITYPDPIVDKAKMGFASDPTATDNVLRGYEWADGIVGGTVLTRPTTQAEQDEKGWPAQVPIYNPNNIKTYNWLDAATRQGVTNNHQLALSAGTETSRLYLSITAFNQKGVQKDQDYKRYNGLISGDITANKWLTLGLSSNISFSTQNYGVNAPSGNTGPKDLYGRAASQFPYAMPYDTSGVAIRNPGGDINNFNPLIDIDQSLNERKATSILASMFSEVKFTKWIKYRLNFGAQYRDYRTGTWGGTTATNQANRASYDYDQRFTYTLENLLYIDKTIADVHSFGVTLLQSIQRIRQEGVRVSVNQTVKPSSLWYDLGANSSATPPTYGSNYTENSLMSYMARINYTLKNKYLLTLTGRSDGASVLAPGHKWDFFPSAALAWKMQEESFLQNINWMDELKLRVSYGGVGNSSVDPYQTSGPLSQNPYVVGSTAAIGFLPQVPANPYLGWERSATTNVGLDFALIKGRLTGSMEVYETNTTDLLLNKSINAAEGFVGKTQNIGKTRNRGIDLVISGIVIDKTDFGWTLDVNWSKYKNEIVTLINGKEDILASRLFIGKPIDVYYNYASDGVWGNSDAELTEMAEFKKNNFNFVPGTTKIVDQNGDYKIDANDYVIRGTSNPKWTGGLTTSFRYKNWSLSSFIYARVGQTYFGSIYPNPGFRFPNGRVEKDYWSASNPSGQWPQPTTASTSAALNIPTAMQYANGSFATVRNISLAYTFPQTWLNRISLKDTQLSVQVLNPFIFGGKAVKLGINPDDTSNWSSGGNKNVSTPNSNTSQPVGGINNNTILPQSVVFGLRTSF